MGNLNGSQLTQIHKSVVLPHSPANSSSSSSETSYAQQNVSLSSNTIPRPDGIHRTSRVTNFSAEQIIVNTVLEEIEIKSRKSHWRELLYTRPSLLGCHSRHQRPTHRSTCTLRLSHKPSLGCRRVSGSTVPTTPDSPVAILIAVAVENIHPALMKSCKDGLHGNNSLSKLSASLNDRAGPPHRLPHRASNMLPVEFHSNCSRPPDVPERNCIDVGEAMRSSRLILLSAAIPTEVKCLLLTGKETSAMCVLYPAHRLPPYRLYLLQRSIPH